MTFEQLLDRWLQIKAEAKRLSDQEIELRRSLFEAAFPNPQEGTNKLELLDGRQLKGVYKINRTLDEASIPAAVEELRKRNDVVVDDIFVVKHSLGTKTYKSLPEAARKIADRAITAKPGTPTLGVE